MNKIILSLSFAIIVIVSLDSCYYDKADVLLGNVSCDTTAFTYSNQVQPIMSQYCVSCHTVNNESGGVRLDNYNNVSIYANNGELVCAINHESGCSPMPKNSSQLNPCDRRIIELWVDDGAPNN